MRDLYELSILAAIFVILIVACHHEFVRVI